MEKTQYKALALDLDGTLMNSNKELSDKNKYAVWEAIEAGTAVILASGRPLFGVRPVADLLELNKRGGFILAYNGGNIWDCKAGKLVYKKEIPANCITDICEVAKEFDAAPLTYFGDKIISERATDEYVIKEAFCNNAEVLQIDDIPAFVNYPVAKLLVVGEHRKLLPVRDKLLNLNGNELDIFFSEDYFLEIVPKNIRKDASIHALLLHLGIRQSELIACGDGLNDISMLKYAGLGVAMKNAYSEVQKIADYIAPSNDDDGVAAVIKKFLLNDK